MKNACGCEVCDICQGHPWPSKDPRFAKGLVDGMCSHCWHDAKGDGTPRCRLCGGVVLENRCACSGEAPCPNDPLHRADDPALT